MLEKILAAIEANTAALTAVAAALKAQAAAKPAETKGADKSAEAKKEEAKKVTLDDVKAALRKYGSASGDMNNAKALLKKVGGVDAVGDLPEEKFATVVAKAEEEAKKASEI